MSASLPCFCFCKGRATQPLSRRKIIHSNFVHRALSSNMRGCNTDTGFPKRKRGWTCCNPSGVNLQPPSTKATQPLSCMRLRITSDSLTCLPTLRRTGSGTQRTFPDVGVAPARMRSIASLLRCSQENPSKGGPSQKKHALDTS